MKKEKPMSILIDADQTTDNKFSIHNKTSQQTTS